MFSWCLLLGMRKRERRCLDVSGSRYGVVYEFDPKEASSLLKQLSKAISSPRLVPHPIPTPPSLAQPDNTKTKP